MKLLLTSAGITNKSLAHALRGVVKGKMRIAFIPTAANMKDGDKHWLIKNYSECDKLGKVEIADISAISKKVWLPMLEWANVILIGGGDTVYLMKWVRKSGLEKELPKLLKSRAYVGISAGSIIMSKTLSTCSDYVFSSKKAPKGLGYVDFNIRSHYHMSHHPKFIDRYLKKIPKSRIKGGMYALDDDSGVLCLNKRIKVISEGKWKKY